MEKDELREYPDLETRERLFLIYKNYLEQQSVPWTIIKGKNQDRVRGAIQIVNGILESSFAIDSQ